jgi:hypothetical protein
VVLRKQQRAAPLHCKFTLDDSATLVEQAQQTKLQGRQCTQSL